MAEESAPGSRNPANSEDFPGGLREILKKFVATDVDDMLPAIVIAYDRALNRVTVKPIIKILKTDETLSEREQIASVPVLNIGGGNAVLSFNIIPGDLGWIKASDRDISLFLQQMAEAPPNTLRIHKFSDGLFIPDKFKNWVLDPEDEANAVLQTLDGTKRISLWDDRIRITTPLFEVVADDSIFSGDVTVGMNLTVIGDTTLSATVTSNGKDISDTHTHSAGGYNIAATPVTGISGTVI